MQTYSSSLGRIWRRNCAASNSSIREGEAGGTGLRPAQSEGKKKKRGLAAINFMLTINSHSLRI